MRRFQVFQLRVIHYHFFYVSLKEYYNTLSKHPFISNEFVFAACQYLLF